MHHVPAFFGPHMATQLTHDELQVLELLVATPRMNVYYCGIKLYIMRCTCS